MNEVLIHMEETYKHQADYKIGKENSAKENKELKKQNTLLKMALVSLSFIDLMLAKFKEGF